MKVLINFLNNEKGNTFGNKIFAVKGEKIVDIDSKEDLDVLLCTTKVVPIEWTEYLKRS